MNTISVTADVKEIECISCDSSAVYKYGKIKTGAQRYICIMCGTQFTPGAKKTAVKGKPACPECSRPMNVYKLEGDVIRFRCSGYPVCRTYKKYTLKEAK